MLSVVPTINISQLHYAIEHNQHQTPTHTDISAKFLSEKKFYLPKISKKNHQRVSYFLQNMTSIPSWPLLYDKNKYGDSLLHSACIAGNIDLVQSLLNHQRCSLYKQQQKQFLCEPNHSLESPLHTACKAGNPYILQGLLNALNKLFDKRELQTIFFQLNTYGDSLLHASCLSNNTDTIDILLSNAVTILEPATLNMFLCHYNQYNDTPLHFACKFGNDHVVELLIRKVHHLSNCFYPFIDFHHFINATGKLGTPLNQVLHYMHHTNHTNHAKLESLQKISQLLYSYQTNTHIYPHYTLSH